jgi:hypothetical protein
MAIFSAANRDSRYAKHTEALQTDIRSLRRFAHCGNAASDSGTIKLNHALHMRSIRRATNRADGAA